MPNLLDQKILNFCTIMSFNDNNMLIDISFITKN